MSNNKKYIGFRVSTDTYVKVIESSSSLGLSITDFILSLVYPAVGSSSEIEKKENPTLSNNYIIKNERKVNISDGSVKRFDQFGIKI